MGSAGSDANFASAVRQRHAKHEFFDSPRRAPLSFGIVHYAGTVEYATVGFVEKNRDTLQEIRRSLVSRAHDGWICREEQKNRDTLQAIIHVALQANLSRLMQTRAAAFVSSLFFEVQPAEVAASKRGGRGAHKVSVGAQFMVRHMTHLFLLAESTCP